MSSLPSPTPKREVIGARLRYDVLRRCNFACYYCGVPASLGIKPLHVDHVLPVSLGGTNDPWNLVAACWDCNLGKANLPPTQALLDAVHGDYCAYESPLDNDSWIDQCKHCGVPFLVYEDEDPDHACMRCSHLIIDSYEQGIVAAFRHPEHCRRIADSIERGH